MPTSGANGITLPRFLLVVGVMYLPLIFLGYGTDGDTYATLEMGRHLRATGEYHPSRFPGYPLFEVPMAFLVPLGGSVLTNLISLGMALWSLVSLYTLVGGIDRVRRLMVLAGVAVHPVFIIAATSTHDLIWALALMLAAAAAVASEQPMRAGLWAGLAVAARLQMAPLTAGFLLYGLWRSRSTPRAWIGGGVLALGLVVVGYLPSAAVAGWSFDFLQVGMSDDKYWIGGLRSAKFAYKNLILWGVPGGLVLLTLMVRAIPALLRNATDSGRRPALVMAAIAILTTEVLFLCYPIEKAYLLPVVPFTFLILGSVPQLSRQNVAALVVAVALLNLASLNLARPDVPKAATGATVGLWLERGDLLEDVAVRFALRRVDTSEGFVDSLAARFGEQTGY